MDCRINKIRNCSVWNSSELFLLSLQEVCYDELCLFSKRETLEFTLRPVEFFCLEKKIDVRLFPSLVFCE